MVTVSTCFGRGRLLVLLLLEAPRLFLFFACIGKGLPRRQRRTFFLTQIVQRTFSVSAFGK